MFAFSGPQHPITYFVLPGLVTFTGQMTSSQVFTFLGGGGGGVGEGLRGGPHVTNDAIKRIKLLEGNKRHDSISTFIVAHQPCTSQKVSDGCSKLLITRGQICHRQGKSLSAFVLNKYIL